MDPYRKLDIDMASLNGTEDRKELEEIHSLQKLFRDKFSDYDGIKVLNVILSDLKYFDVCNNERDMALRNYATFLLEERMGLKNSVSMTEMLLKTEAE